MSVIMGCGGDRLWVMTDFAKMLVTSDEMMTDLIVTMTDFWEMLVTGWQLVTDFGDR